MQLKHYIKCGLKSQLRLAFLLGLGKTDANTINVGVMTGPEFEVAQIAKQVAKEKYNLEVELITFNDYIIPNEALNQGDLDVNAYQTVPFLEEQEKQRGYKLEPIGNTFLYPIVGYSKKIKSINE